MRIRLRHKQPFTSVDDLTILNPPPHLCYPPGRGARSGQPNLRAIADALDRTTSSIKGRRQILLHLQRKAS